MLGCPLLDVPDRVRSLSLALRNLKKNLAAGGDPAREADVPGPPRLDTAEPAYQQLRDALCAAARVLNVAALDVPERIQSLTSEVEQLKVRIAALHASGLTSAESLIDGSEQVAGVHVVICETPGANSNLMRQLIDGVRRKADHVAVLLAAKQASDKVLLVAGLSESLVDRGLSAGDWVRQVAAVAGGSGGGRPDMAQAGGKHPEKLPDALIEARRVIGEMLGTRAS